jgi:hypothetical protein
MKFKRLLRVGLPLAILTIMACAPPMAQADTFSFLCITSNTPDCGSLESQLFVQVTDPGANQVLFTFFNLGPLASSITDIYFDDGSLLGIASITSSSGVSFSQNASPGNLPSGNNASPPFMATEGFTADSDPPAQPNGVNPPNEWVGILFDLKADQEFSHTIAALLSGELRIGIHVQGIGATGGSESLVHDPGSWVPQEVIPEPMSIVLLGTALLGITNRLRKRSSI